MKHRRLKKAEHKWKRKRRLNFCFPIIFIHSRRMWSTFM